MKNKRKIKYAAAIIAAFLFFGCAAAFPGSEEAIVESLVRQRTDAMAGFFAGQVGREEAIETLNYVETDLLREKDVANIDAYFRTDIEQVRAYEFESIRITDAEDELICAEVTIKWESEGLEGKEEFSHTYDVICVYEENRYKLAQFY